MTKIERALVGAMVLALTVTLLGLVSNSMASSFERAGHRIEGGRQ